MYRFKSILNIVKDVQVQIKYNDREHGHVDQVYLGQNTKRPVVWKVYQVEKK